MKSYTNEMYRGFVEALLWSSQSEEDQERDFTDLGKSDISYEARTLILLKILDFTLHSQIAPILHDIDYRTTECTNFEMIGHDLALTINGHGAGFFDRDYLEHARLLDSIASELGGLSPYVSGTIIEVETC